VLGPYTFRIGDTSRYGAYTNGGLARQVKDPAVLEFVPFCEAVDNAADLFIVSDFGKDPAQLHLAFLVGRVGGQMSW
jgi:ubiquitin-activating enzyme E1